MVSLFLFLLFFFLFFFLPIFGSSPHIPLPYIPLGWIGFISFFCATLRSSDVTSRVARGFMEPYSDSLGYSFLPPVIVAPFTNLPTFLGTFLLSGLLSYSSCHIILTQPSFFIITCLISFYDRFAFLVMWFPLPVSISLFRLSFVES